MIKAKKALDKEELVARLKELSVTTIRQKEFMGAMCYSPSIPPIEHTKCDWCGDDIAYENWHDEREAIYKTVQSIVNLGYDAKVEVCCMKCAETLAEDLHFGDETQKEEDSTYDATFHLGEINYLFSFKPKDGDNYHVCIANSVGQYKSLHSLLSNRTSYSDYYDFIHYVADEKDVLKYMTGIDFDGQD